MNTQLLVTAGRGPRECELAVTRLTATLKAEATATGLTVADGPTVPGSVKGGTRSAVLIVTGDGARQWAATTVGPVQWIATSPLRPEHRRRNWFVQVALIDSCNRHLGDQASFNEADVTIKPIRSGGPGGQRRNKVATAVRAEHTPSGRTVVASNERTLTANRATALARLADMAATAQLAHDRNKADLQWQHHDKIERGNPVRIIRAPLD